MSFSVDEIRDLYPFRSHFARVDGCRIHYLDEGSGSPLLLLHGNPTWSFMYRRLVLSLRESYRVIVPDHVGCGLSDKPSSKRYDYVFSRRVADLEELLFHLDLREKLTLVVHDWGGLIGFAFACRYPERVGRLIVFNTTAFFLSTKERLHWSIRVCRTSRLAGYLILKFNLFARVASLLATTRRMPDRVRRAYLGPYESSSNRIATLRFVQDIPLSPADPSFALLQETEKHLDRLLDKPMLICWGARDFVFTEAFLEDWQLRFPGAEVHRFAEAGHYVLEDAFDEISPLVARFLLDHAIE